MSVEWVTHEHRVFYVIEAVCQVGCAAHEKGVWYESTHYRSLLQSPATSREYAEILLERLREKYPKGQYRLVEHVETHHHTKEILA